MKRDRSNKSLWQDTDFDELPKDAVPQAETIYDVIIVGAGITGITTGYNLVQQGKKVLILEAQTPGFGTTGGTTAHLNNFFDTSYDEVIKKIWVGRSKTFSRRW